MARATPEKFTLACRSVVQPPLSGSGMLRFYVVEPISHWSDGGVCASNEPRPCISPATCMSQVAGILAEGHGLQPLWAHNAVSYPHPAFPLSEVYAKSWKARGA